MIELRRLLVPGVFFGILAISSVDASTTTLDGSPTLFEVINIGDFNDGTAQGWTINPLGGGVFLPGTELQNNDPVSGGDPTVSLNLNNSTLPGVPSTVTLGSLPGQYDIVQFRLRFDTLPAAAIANTAVAGDQFFLTGGPNAREPFYVNNGTGIQGVDTVPELQTDGAYHTYTIQRAPTDAGWGSSYSVVRIDPINTSDAVGTLFSIDDVKLARSNDVQAFPAFVEPVPPNLIANGGFDALTDPTPPTATGAWNINGSNGNFTLFQGQTVTVDNWGVHFDDPNNLVPAVNGGELNGSFYLDTHRRVAGGDVTLNSAMGYLNGLVQENILSGVTIDPAATYEFSFDLGQNAGTNQSQASFQIGLTVGTGADATNPANAIAGSLLDVTDFSTVPNAKTTNTLMVSGADLLAAQSSGQVNVFFQTRNLAAIPGFPGSVASGDVSSTAIVSQVMIDNLSLISPNVFPAGDVNKDGVVDQADVDVAQLYLDGDGGATAAVRQNTLTAAGNAAAAVLAGLNLTDFDLTGNDFFDAADVAAIAALANGAGLPGDFNSDGFVNAADYTVWRDNLNAPESVLPPGTGDNSGSVDPGDYTIWKNNFGSPAVSGLSASTAAVPEPATVGMLLLACAAAAVARRVR
ncbi:hypothetical protein Pla175_42310 [Pirellulimonas nuda]|uniref:Dockerin domain-containing protein n=1 Tax=Pirellulimonas nuda TaxID=2528009 RepID=A0A518DH63_9BACT|nr:PEP-CTERM sorting domain-containing protein [Pirellulimonas nuda]QDU90818.1 hypothetical protein Pla175_42310 [Pirellulimonas nuda]